METKDKRLILPVTPGGFRPAIAAAAVAALAAGVANAFGAPQVDGVELGGSGARSYAARRRRNQRARTAWGMGRPRKATKSFAGGGKPFKGSNAARRGARMAQKREKAGARARRSRRAVRVMTKGW